MFGAMVPNPLGLKMTQHTMRAVLEESAYGHYHQTPPKTIFFFKIGFRLKEDNINKDHTFIQIRTITSLPF